MIFMLKAMFGVFHGRCWFRALRKHSFSEDFAVKPDEVSFNSAMEACEKAGPRVLLLPGSGTV